MTARLLDRCGIGYRIVVDEDDETLAQYVENFGDRVETFKRAEWAKAERALDNFGKHGVSPARNYIVKTYPRCWMMDDDITGFKVTRGRRNVAAKPGAVAGILESVERFAELSGCCCTGLQTTATMWPDTPRLKNQGYQVMFFTGEGSPEFRGLIGEDCFSVITQWSRGVPWYGLNFCGFCSPQTKTKAGGLTDTYESDGGSDIRRTAYLLLANPSIVRLVREHWNVRLSGIVPKRVAA